MSNGHIKRYLDQYMAMSQTDFAVFITGEWGCGKTFFIDEYIDELRKKSAKVWKVSLNGAFDEEVISSRLLENIIPKPRQNSVRMLGRMLVGAAGRWLKFDLKDFFKQEEITTFASGFMSKPDLLIFDDFERCPMPPSSRLGAVSAFVEAGQKVIVVGAENELDQVRNEKAYERIREKVIGKTFTVTTNLGEVFPTLIGKGVFKSAEKMLLESKEAIVSTLDAFCDGHQCNLRALKHCFRDFDCFVSKIENRYMESRQFCLDLSVVFISLDYVKQTGALKFEDFIRPDVPVGEQQTPVVFEEVLHKLGLDGSLNGNQNHELVFNDDLWRDILWDRPVSNDRINEALQYLKYFHVEEIPDWFKLWHWHDYSDNEASSIVATIFEGINEGRYKFPGEIMLIFRCLVELSSQGAVKKSSVELVSMFKNYMDSLISDDSLIYSGDDDEYWRESDNWKGHIYWKLSDKDVLKQLIKAMEEKLRSADVKRRKREVSDLVRMLEAHPDEFVAELKHSFRRKPCFDLIDVDTFWSVFVGMPNQTKRELTFCLKDRWSDSGVFHAEVKFSDALKEHCDQYLGDNQSNEYSPSIANVKFLRDGIKTLSQNALPI